MSTTKTHFVVPIYTNDSAIKKEGSGNYGRAHELLFALMDHKAELRKKLDEGIEALPITGGEVEEFASFVDSLSLTFDLLIDLCWGVLGTTDDVKPKKASK